MREAAGVRFRVAGAVAVVLTAGLGLMPKAALAVEAAGGEIQSTMASDAVMSARDAD